MTSFGVTGHQDLSLRTRLLVAPEVASVLSRNDGSLTGVSSLAAGADQLFAHLVLAVGARLTVVLPCEKYEETFSDAADRAQFEALLGLASHCETLNYEAPSEEAFMAAGRRIVDLSDRLVAIWDGLQAAGFGGTGDVVGYAAAQQVETTRVWPSSARRGL